MSGGQVVVEAVPLQKAPATRSAEAGRQGQIDHAVDAAGVEIAEVPLIRAPKVSVGLLVITLTRPAGRIAAELGA